MKPTLGRIVRYHGYEANGNRQHPAIITRVWSEGSLNGEQYTVVNLTVFPDCEQPVIRSSAYLFKDELSAQHAEAPQYAFFPGIE